MYEIIEMKKYHLDKIKDNLQIEFDDFWSVETLKCELENSNCKYFVAIDKFENIVGFAGIFITPDDVELMNIVVKKDKRNLGIGKIILDKIIEEYRKIKLENKNIVRLTLEVNENNLHAIKLYKSRNFIECGKRKKYYNNKDTALIMELI